MTEKSGGNIQDGSDKVKIYSSNEERVKFLGDVLANDASRSIFLLLAQGELPAGRIADKTGMSLALVTHHLEKMQNAGVVRVSKVSKNAKNRDMKHYRAVLAILVIPEESHGRARDRKALALSLKRILRFSSIGIAGVSTWLTVKYAGFTEPAIAPTSPEPSAPTTPGTARADSIRPVCINHVRTTRADRGGAGNSDTWIGHRAGFGLRKEIVCVCVVPRKTSNVRKMYQIRF